MMKRSPSEWLEAAGAAISIGLSWLLVVVELTLRVFWQIAAVAILAAFLSDDD